jgi:hypothetical protein
MKLPSSAISFCGVRLARSKMYRKFPRPTPHPAFRRRASVVQLRGGVQGVGNLSFCGFDSRGILQDRGVPSRYRRTEIIHGQSGQALEIRE